LNKNGEILVLSKINILIIGSGGREHALAWKIKQSPLLGELYCAPGNAGTAKLGNNIDICNDDIIALADFGERHNIGLTVVGPEVPLCLGVVDEFNKRGLKIFGPNKESARLEGSKSFMKEILSKSGVPTAKYEKHTNVDDALTALNRFDEQVVIKADGLAAGKGVLICATKMQAKNAIKTAMIDRKFGNAGDTVLIEEMLEGEEASVLAFCDGEDFLLMPSSQDHKRIGDGDTGPNTGGMGAYSPAPVVTSDLEKDISKNIFSPVLKTMSELGAPYKGILYAGLMITQVGPKVLEFNCRFGDPECQPIMLRLSSDIVPVLVACANGEINNHKPKWDNDTAVCVVMASGGYPGNYDKGKTIRGIDEANAVEGVVVFHAGTKLDGNDVVTSGGRVLGVTAKGIDVRTAIDNAYEAVEKITWDGAVYRGDIGHRAISR
tara:strand:+ start:49707 stop:51014 length:1308 start_codon:yes stop_codon:yes gene_type:complete